MVERPTFKRSLESYEQKYPLGSIIKRISDKEKFAFVSSHQKVDSEGKITVTRIFSLKSKHLPDSKTRDDWHITDIREATEAEQVQISLIITKLHLGASTKSRRKK